MSNSHPGPDDPTAQLILSLVGPSFEIPSGVDWTRALDLLHLHALGPLAAATDRAFGGGLLPSGVRSSLDPTYRRTAIHTALTLETAGRARTALTEAGIPSLVFKGAGLVDQGVYPDPGSRPMDDVDLLVRPEDAASAVEALGRSGFLPWTPWEPGRSHWLDSMSFLDEAAPPGVALAVDLHWRTEYGHMRFGDPEGGSVLWDGADVEAGTPSYEAHLQVVAEQRPEALALQGSFSGTGRSKPGSGAGRRLGRVFTLGSEPQDGSSGRTRPRLGPLRGRSENSRRRGPAPGGSWDLGR